MRFNKYMLLGLFLINPAFAWYDFHGGPTFDYTALPMQAAKLTEQIAKAKAMSTNLTQLTGQLNAAKSLLSTEFAQNITIGQRTSAITTANSDKLLNLFSNKVSTVLSPVGLVGSTERIDSYDALLTKEAAKKTVGNGAVVARARTLRMFGNQQTATDVASEKGGTSQQTANALQNGNYEEQAIIMEEVVKGQEFKTEYRKTAEELAATPSESIMEAWNAVKQLENVNSAAKLQANSEKTMLDYQRLQLLNSRNSLNDLKMQYNASQQDARAAVQDIQK
jgi:hypothetical protein